MKLQTIKNNTHQQKGNKFLTSFMPSFNFAGEIYSQTCEPQIYAKSICGKLSQVYCLSCDSINTPINIQLNTQRTVSWIGGQQNLSCWGFSTIVIFLLDLITSFLPKHLPNLSPGSTYPA